MYLFLKLHFLDSLIARVPYVIQFVQPDTCQLMYKGMLCIPGGSDGKESACSVGDLGLIPGLGRSPGGGHSNPLQYSCLENPKDRGA